MATLRLVNLAVRFLLELAALVAFGFWGLRTGDSIISSLLLCIGAPTAAIVFWWLFVAPRSRFALPAAVKLVLGLAVLGLAALALVATHQYLTSVVYTALVVVNQILLLVARQDVTQPLRGR